MAHLVPDFKQPPANDALLPPVPSPLPAGSPFEGAETTGQLSQIFGQQSRQTLQNSVFEQRSPGATLDLNAQGGLRSLNQQSFGSLLPQLFQAQIGISDTPITGDELDREVNQRVQQFSRNLNQLQTQLRTSAIQGGNPFGLQTNPLQQLGGLLGLRLF